MFVVVVQGNGCAVKSQWWWWWWWWHWLWQH